MKKRFFPHFVFFLLFVGLWVSSCRKKQVAPRPSANAMYQDATIIGFDPCTGTSGRGLLLAVAGSPDTVVTYTFPPGLCSFPLSLFQGGVLFPALEQAKYRVRVAYHPTPPTQRVSMLCQGNVNLGDFNRFTKGRQITITAAEMRR